MIREIHVENQDVWDAAVRSFEDYDIFYLCGYAKAFMEEAQKNGRPLLLLYEDGKDRAMNVVFRRDVALDEKLKGKVETGRYYDLITPYGYGGFCGHVTDWEKLNRAYVQYCTERRYVCEFVRFGLFHEYYANYVGEVEARMHNVVRSLEMPIDKIWMDFKQKVRKNVKKANTYGLQVFAENTGEHFDDFFRIYDSTMERKGAKSRYRFSKQFYRRLNKLEDNVMYFYAVYKGQVVSAELVVYGAQNAYSYLGGTDQSYFAVRPNDFLKYEIIKWAKEKGLRNFVLGGGYGSDDGIYQYKQSLAPHGVRDFYVGRNIFHNNDYEKLVSLREGEVDGCHFFPLYRA